MGPDRVAVVGIGQTKHAAKRGDVSMAGLVREAADRALEDAGMTWHDIDAVVIGKAPDFFEGVMMPELYLADALGAAGKPMIRVHTAGSVGGSTAIVAASLVEAGMHERVLTVACREAVGVQRHVGAVDPDPVQHAAASRAPAATSPRTSAPTSGARGARPHRHPGGGEGPPQRAEEPLRAPARARHHLRHGQGVADAVGPDPLLARPARPPTAPARWCSATRRPPSGAPPPAHRRPGSTAPPCAPSRPCPPGATRSTRRPARDCAADVYAQAGHHQPASRRSTCAEIYVPFSLVRADVAGEPRLRRPRARAGSSPRTARPPIDGDAPGQLLGRRAVVEPDRRLGHDPLRRGGHAGAWARPATTRSTVPARPWATPTAAARSSSRCGSSAATSPDPRPAHTGGARGTALRARR